MGFPAAKQGDQITGVHIHTVLVPSQGAAPLPFPFTGKIDGGLSRDVNIEGMPGANMDSTATNTPQHLPVPGPFQVPPSNKASILNGSTSVFINGKPAVRAGDPALACDLPGAQVVAEGTVFIG